MDLTLRQILDAKGGLDKLLTMTTLPIKVSWKLASLAKALQGQLALFQEQQQKVLEKHGIKQGQKDSDIKQDVRDAVQKEIGELLDQKVAVDYDKVELPESTTGLTGGELVGLSTIVNVAGCDAEPSSSD